MQAWLRLLIVWCIAIALPVQGMAGVTMAHCGASHARMAAAVDATQHHHAGHDAAAAHHHDAGHAQDGHELEPAPSTCSSCASCCAGSALPCAAPRVPEPLAAPAVFAEEVVTIDACASDGPDRPPRIRSV